MQVNRNNFDSVLPEILKDIKQAEFIAIDCEFTGLGIEKSQRNDIIDTLQERYAKVSQVASQFIPIQIGICTFRYDATKKCYRANPYNFQVFPRTGNKVFGLDRVFQCQVGSLEFLQSCEFDWNEWIANGISFVNLDQEERIRARLDKMAESDPPVEPTHSLYEFQAEVTQRVQDFLQNSTDLSIEILSPSPSHKRVINQTIIREFKGAVLCNNKRKSVLVVKQSADQRKDYAIKSNALVNELEQLIGFRKVMEAVAESKVPLIGHNMYLDLCYIYYNFFRSFPGQVEEFHSTLHQLFPNIYDSKYVASTSTLLQSSVDNTSLEHLFEVFQTENFKNRPIVELGKEVYANNRAHEAGFDAYATGVVFLRACALTHNRPKIDFDKQSAMLNKLNMMNSTLPYINIHGEPGEADFSNMFLLSNFPSNWKTSDIQYTFKDFGQFYIKWINDQECLLILKDKEKVPEALEMMKRPEKKSRTWTLRAFTGKTNPSSELPEGRKRKRQNEDEEHPRKINKCLVQ